MVRTVSWCKLPYHNLTLKKQATLISHHCLFAGAPTQWPDAQLGPLNPAHPRFPMPGHVGLSPHLQAARQRRGRDAAQHLAQESDLFTGLLPQDRHVTAIEEFVTANREVRRGVGCQFITFLGKPD